MTVFLDTNALIAFANKHDQLYPQAYAEFSRLETSHTTLLTTNFIIDETLTYLLNRIGYKATITLGDILFAQTTIQLHRLTSLQEHSAYEVFKRFNRDKSWSFTDCTSFVVMKARRLTQVFTFDHHFSQMGFTVIPSQKPEV